ncbi:MAG: iron chelate uptake ABC transporter family permease subunit [Microbacterium sp.]|uniref:FecCD family ABC transporter permease n=1 Tax=Microbacterium sp. TaxID=51671 RepID=UPI0039E45272
MSTPLVLRVGPFSVRTSVRVLSVSAALLVLCAGLALWAMTLGTYAVGPGDIAAAFAGRADSAVTRVVVEWRAPRVFAALLFGAALAVSGAVFQSLTRNPLGSPDVIGFSAGSYTGVVAVLLLGANGYTARAGGALAGGVLTALVVYLLALRRGMQGFRLIVIGIGVGAFLSALNSWFAVKADVDLALAAAVWGAGSLSLVDWQTLATATPALAVLALCAPAAQRRMRRLELGDDTAAMLGIPVERTKALLVLFAVTAVAVATAAAGPISFVALAAPQIARRLTGHGSSTDLAGAALVGGVILLAADMVAQHAIPGIALPTGAVTVCVGGLYLVILLARESRRFARGAGR